MKRVWRRFRNMFRGPQGIQGIQGPQGLQGEPGWITFDGLPDGCRIAIWDKDRNLVWSGVVTEVNR